MTDALNLKDENRPMQNARIIMPVFKKVEHIGLSLHYS